ncbi:protein of unknown function [Rhodovastum atsumiense]|nr:protein of unknown function [Rhodovastum atsumiense]
MLETVPEHHHAAHELPACVTDYQDKFLL